MFSRVPTSHILQAAAPLRRRIVPLPPGLFHEVQQVLTALDQHEVPLQEGIERFKDLVMHKQPLDYDPETEEIVFQEKRSAQSVVPRIYGKAN